MALSFPDRDLLIPENPLDATDEYDADYDVAAALDFRRLLKQIDERLDLIWVRPGTTVFPKGERWYITRRNDEGRASYWLVEDEHEQFCVPDIRHLQRLQEYDTWAHPDVWQKFERKRIDKKLRAKQAHEDKREEFRTKLGERLAHEFDANIAVTGSMKALMNGETVEREPPLPPRKQQRRRHRNR